MSAFSQLVMFFWTQNSSHHSAIRFCGDLVLWRSQFESALGFSSCQQVHMSGVWIHAAAANTITLHSALDPVTKLLTFLFSFISAPPTCLAPTVSCAVNMRNKEGLSADTADRSEGRDDVLIAMLFTKVK